MADPKALKKRIHAMCRDLGLDNDVRHDIQLAATGKGSMTDMTVADLVKVVDALKAKGWKPKRAGKWRSASPRADIRKIHVLWRLLAEAGVYKKGAAALNAFINSTKFAEKYGHATRDVDMLPADMAQDVIEALKDIAKRHQVRLSR